MCVHVEQSEVEVDRSSRDNVHHVQKAGTKGPPEKMFPSRDFRLHTLYGTFIFTVEKFQASLEKYSAHSITCPFFSTPCHTFLR